MVNHMSVLNRLAAQFQGTQVAPFDLKHWKGYG